MQRAFPVGRARRDRSGAIDESERLHSGEIRFAIEAALEPHEVWRGKYAAASARSRCSRRSGVWDTEANNGVLIYVLLADHDVEIVADRGFNERVSAERVGRDLP